METTKLLSKTEINELKFKSEKELRETQSLEVKKMQKMLDELYKILQITNSISINSFLSKYGANHYLQTMKKKGLIKKSGPSSLSEWHWDSPKEPNQQTAGEILKNGGCYLFKETIKEQIVSPEKKEKDIQESRPKRINKYSQVKKKKDSNSEIEEDEEYSKAYSKEDIEMDNYGIDSFKNGYDFGFKKGFNEYRKQELIWNTELIELRKYAMEMFKALKSDDLPLTNSDQVSITMSYALDHAEYFLMFSEKRLLRIYEKKRK